MNKHLSSHFILKIISKFKYQLDSSAGNEILQYVKFLSTFRFIIYGFNSVFLLSVSFYKNIYVALLGKKNKRLRYRILGHQSQRILKTHK